MKKYFTATVFLILIIMPAVLGGIKLICGKTVDVSLFNDEAVLKENKFTSESYFDGSFQQTFSDNFKNGFVPRGIYTKAYNQVVYSLFSVSNNIIVGKDGCLFQESYINEFYGLGDGCDFSKVENMEKLDDYLNKLGAITKKLDAMGKKLVVYTTPNKCDYMEKYIPSKYKIKKNNLRGVDYIKENAEKYGITYFDAKDFIEKSDYPVFYKSGIHWSRVSEQTVSSKFAEMLGEKAEVSGKLIKSNKELWRECDLYNMLNIWSRPNEIYFAFEGIRAEKSPKKVLIQGGSFSEGLAKDFFENGIFSEVNDIFYGRYINLRADEKQVKITNWKFEEPIFDAVLKNSDIVIIEINESNVNLYSSGFVDFLYKDLV